MITAAEKGLSKVEEDELTVKYVPIGETEEIRLSLTLVLKYLMPPTKNGLVASKSDAMKFIMLCRARALNPWTGDAYAVGYEEQTRDGYVAKYNLITAAQAMFKRAELHPEYDGIESGVIIRRHGSEDFEYRSGDFFAEGEVLLGGWARVYRRDKSKPFFEALKLASFNKNVSVWRGCPEGMISKTAEVGALRKAFPTQLGGLYTREEIDSQMTIEVPEKPKVINDLDDITRELKARKARIEQGESPQRFEVDPETEVEEAVRPVKPEAKAAAKAKAAAVPETVEYEVQPGEVMLESEPEEEDEESGVYVDYKAQIDSIDSDVDCQILSRAIRGSHSLDSVEKSMLLKLVDRKLREVAG